MTDKERKSCICTIKMLRNLAFNVHEVMDVIDYENCEKMISLLESFEQTAQPWIPCKERLPEKDGEYLTTTEDGLCDVESYGDGEWYYDDVVAWAPLPEPWKGEADG